MGSEATPGMAPIAGPPGDIDLAPCCDHRREITNQALLQQCGFQVQGPLGPYQCPHSMCRRHRYRNHTGPNQDAWVCNCHYDGSLTGRGPRPVRSPTIAVTKQDHEDEDRPAQCGSCSNGCHRSPGVVFRLGATSFHAGRFCSSDCQAAAWGNDTVTADRPRRCCSPGCQAPRREVTRCKGLGPSVVEALRCPHYVCQRHWKITNPSGRLGVCPCHLPHMDDDLGAGFLSESDTTDTDADPPEDDLYGYKMRAGGALAYFVERLNRDRATGGAGGGSSSSGSQEPAGGGNACGHCGV